MLLSLQEAQGSMKHFRHAGTHRREVKEEPKVVPSVWQQPDDRGEEHEEPDTGEGQRYPGEREEARQLGSSARITRIISITATSHDAQDSLL